MITLLKETLEAALPDNVIMLHELEFHFCPLCALDLICKYGIDEAFRRGLDGQLSYSIGTSKSQFKFHHCEDISAIYGMRLAQQQA